MVNAKRIGIIGAGWLGKSLIENWLPKHLIRYTKRNESLSINNASFYPYEFGENLDDSFFDELDYLVITSTLPKELTVVSQLVDELHAKLERKTTIVFTSTIGVYNDIEGILDESSVEVNKTSIYYQFESALQSTLENNMIILRLGGLIGEDRHPVKYLAGRVGIADGQKVVNLIHKQDIIHFMSLIVDEKVPTGIYNLVHPHHPTRREYYTLHAQLRGLELPQFLVSEGSGKVIDVQKSLTIDGFNYWTKI